MDYENARSNQISYRALRDVFGQFNGPNVRTIGKIVQKFEQTGSVGDVKTPVYAGIARTAENIAADLDSVAEEPSTSTHRRAQQMHLSRSSLMNIMHKDLHLHAYKVQLTEELKHQGKKWQQWMINFRRKSSSVMRHIFTSVDSSISRITAFGRMIIQE